ncbi:hypothetical protein [Sinorhizobium sp. RAC02]|uniref:hypothetical protein n=1 Tax=Sinorhizobium sp. RAC02 TaxID=1842534 RepID=UPI00083CEDFF|nr:hypothetical protein [Sinorhizobium sp. RAC02]AOF89385.1 hypothetical protein BSY16_4002 [Sinorhizobium sp. RAC02]
MVKVVQPAFDRVFQGDEGAAELAKVLWKETVAALKELDAATAANLARADRYVRAKVEFENLYPMAFQQGPVLKGEEGGEYFNYRWSACEKLNERMLKLEKAMFGEAAVKASAKKPAAGSTAADEFLGPNHGLRQ